ncbi:HlyD family efflux transporter periplasmic adaptor subunit, partial [Klebsiella pneumoniae]|nr:HlyD family efflux transporter periplasmic adaptor subunit [Klebsiella pneumoniae]
AGQPLVTITQNRNLLIRAEIQPRYYATLGNIVNATIKHRLTTQSLEELGGRLVSYGKTVDTTTPLIPITFEIQNKSDFLPGSFVEMFIRTRGARPTITVPAISL